VNENSFYQFVEEFKVLESGIIIRTKNGLQRVRLILSLIIGDNLAVNSILGYVQFNFQSDIAAFVLERNPKWK